MLKIKDFMKDLKLNPNKGTTFIKKYFSIIKCLFQKFIYYLTIFL